MVKIVLQKLRDFLSSLIIAFTICLAGISLMILAHEFTHVFEAQSKGMKAKAVAIDLEPDNGILAYTIVERSENTNPLNETLPNIVGWSVYAIFVIITSIIIFGAIRH
jgi:ABC-type antimicrobial peptide transport system permease subunit